MDYLSHCSSPKALGCYQFRDLKGYNYMIWVIAYKSTYFITSVDYIARVTASLNEQIILLCTIYRNACYAHANKCVCLVDFE